MAGKWTRFADLHRHLDAPLRPLPQDVDLMRRAIAGRDGAVLLLGVTPGLAALGADLTAVDGALRMIREVWPGDRPDRRAMVGDWRHLPVADASRDAVIGDGALNSAGRCLNEVLGEIARILKPDGIAAFRCFCAPEAPEDLAAIGRDVAAGGCGNFHALKWRIAMALAAEAPDRYVPVAQTLQTFNALFPDRAALCALTGWPESDVASIDFYEDASHGLVYPTEREMIARLAAHFPHATALHVAGYPLAERCPTLVFARHPGLLP